MTTLTSELLTGLATQQAPCVSLYQPTHRRYPENQQDPIRFRNLVKDLEASLLEQYTATEAQQLLQPLRALANDTEFWNHTLDGLVVLRAPGMFQALRLPQAVSELAVIAETFHTKPLRRFLQSIDRYQVLGLSLDEIRLFEGNRYVLDEMPVPPTVPRTIAEALGEELTEPHLTVASYGGVGTANMYHGHGSKSAEVDKDAERFFRAVDRAVLQHCSKPTGLPLVLAALPEHHHVFREVSRNPFLMSDGVKFHPDSLTPDELRALTWQVINPRYEAQVAALCDEFEQARSKGRASDDLAQVAEAAISGRVATLLLEADRHAAGRIDDTTGRVEAAKLSDPRVDDVFDDLGELVANRGGLVLVIPAERMPSQSGLAAIYRY